MSRVTKSVQLQPGDVLLYRTTTWMGRAIRILDGAEVSHAALFLGDDEVAEALVKPGLVRQSIEKSIEKDTDWVAVYRLKRTPESMSPVLKVAQGYLDHDNRYSYEQILLLAGICLTRKIDLDSPLLRRLCRAAMRKAVDLIGCLHAEGKEPMICSEFVFRTYDEAMPEPDDPYSLEILSQKIKSHRHFSRFRRRRLASVATQDETPVVHPESLFGRLERSGETVETLSATGVCKSALPQADEDLDVLIEQYVTEFEEGKEPHPLFAASPNVTTDELLDTARLLAITLTTSATQKSDHEKQLYGAPPSAELPLTTFSDILADFVTPGDLFKSPSLEKIGTITP